MRRVRHKSMTHPFFKVVSGSAFIPCIIQIPADLPPPGVPADLQSVGIASHFQKHSSLFTKSVETPINTGVARGEELRTTLHPSSPSDCARN